jgi:aspartyl protease family protein
MPGFREAFLSGRNEGFARRGFERHAQTAFQPVRPSAEAPTARPPLTIRADRYGQFYLTVNADGAVFRCLADTGASDLVFRKRDAAQLGLSLGQMAFDQNAWTANGTVYGAAFRLRQLVIGSCELTDVPAWINGGELEYPLLGMSVLRLMKMTVADGTMTLR